MKKSQKRSDISLRKLAVWLPVRLIKLYKLFLSPYMGNNCRFVPTCSTYAIEALEKYGIFKGSWLAFKRILRCNPYCKGGYDPVP